MILAKILILSMYIWKTKIVNRDGNIKLVIINNFKNKLLYKNIDTFYIRAKIV